MSVFQEVTAFLGRHGFSASGYDVNTVIEEKKVGADEIAKAKKAEEAAKAAEAEGEEA